MTPPDPRQAWWEREMRAVPCARCRFERAAHLSVDDGMCPEEFVPDYPALAALVATPLAELEEALEDIKEYWNGHANERAMEDACHHAITRAGAALARLPWRETP